MIVSLGEEEAAAISAPYLASLLEPLRGAQQRGLLGKDKPEAEHSAGTSRSLVPASWWERKGTVLPICWRGPGPTVFSASVKAERCQTFPGFGFRGQGRSHVMTPGPRSLRPR